ncbi:hypothetical protein MJH12_09150, partial [bacterium]|nr:hypothetical protein [bacterium]
MKDLHVYIFIDALGFEIINQYGFLKNELPFQKKLKSIFGYSSTCIPSILTGSTPDQHGHFSSFYMSKDSPFKYLWPLKFVPGFIRSRSRFRGLVSKLVATVSGYTGYFSLYHIPYKDVAKFDYLEKKDIYKKGGIINENSTFFDLLQESQVAYKHSNWKRNDQHNLEEALSWIQEDDQEFIYVYCSELDALLHQEGKFSDKVE